MQMHGHQTRGRKLAVFVWVAVFVLGTGWNDRASSEVINIGWTGEYWSTLPFRVATEMGFLKEKDFKPGSSRCARH